MVLLTLGNVPLATLVAALKEIPGGSPDRLYLYGGVPPVAAGKGVFTLPPDGRLPKFGMSGAAGRVLRLQLVASDAAAAGRRRPGHRM